MTNSISASKILSHVYPQKHFKTFDTLKRETWTTFSKTEVFSQNASTSFSPIVWA